jgi:cytochrome c oxidase subunit 1
MPTPSYLTATGGLRSWLTTTDHKRIGLLYMAVIFTFFLTAMAFAVTFRLNLWSPGSRLMSHNTYNRLLTLHGVAMIFLFIIPGVPSILGNFFLPILIGARDVAFPRLNLASWYFFLTGGLLALVSIALGGPDTGWTFYVPYSLQTQTNMVIPLTAVFLIGISSILTGLNFITTIHRLRAPAMGWFDMPLFPWTLYGTSWVQVIATPVIGITLMMIVLERVTGAAIFDPVRGGDPVLYQHLFWIYSHPAVYIMILPAMGIASEVFPTMSRKKIFGYGFIVYSTVGIATIGSLVWGHHMFVSGMGETAGIAFSLLTFLVALPSGVKIFNWIGTMYKGSIQFAPPMIWACLFIFLFSIGGLTGLWQGALSINLHIHDTAFIVGHFHYVMFGGAAAMFFGGLHYWWPKMFGRMYNMKVATIVPLVFFVGFNMLYFSLLMAGMAGMPRRYADYLPRYTIYHRVATVGSWILAASLLTMFANLFWGAIKGPRAPRNPWGGATLEWQAASPPVAENFDRPIDFTRKAYDYPREIDHG